MDWIFTFVSSYLIGSFSTAFFVGKMFLGKDLSQEGSGNLGAMNSLKTSGLIFGIIVFSIDVIKGGGIIILNKALYGETILLYLAALAVIVGHNYSVFIGFRGGKGLASLVGIMAVLNPNLLVIEVILAIIFFVLTRHAGVAVILAIAPYSVIFLLTNGDWRSVPFSILQTIVILTKHRPEEYRELFKFLHIENGSRPD